VPAERPATAHDARPHAGRALQVQVVAPDGVVWEGDAAAVTVPSALGSLGVLRGHESVAAVLVRGEVRVTPVDGDARAFRVTGGFVVVDDDDVTVLVDALDTPGVA
jgi:F-type H+-transporting ATPase subunit epsilon